MTDRLPPQFPNNCPINERTSDGELVGRCWLMTKEDICPRHGNVKEALEKYRTTGELTNELL